MQNAKNAVALCALALAGAGWAQAQGVPPKAAAMPAAAASSVPAVAKPTDSMNGSVTTVGELLKVENQLALKQAMKAKVDAGLVPADTPVQMKGPKVVPPVPAVFVESIFGVGNSLRANLSIGSDRFENVGPGARVKGCEIERIESRCVVMRPAAAAHKGQSHAACSTACWTGSRPLPAFAAIAPAAGSAGGQSPFPVGSIGMPLPAPIPSSAAQVVAPAGMASPAGVAAPAVQH